MAKLMPKSFIQNRVRLLHSVFPVRTYMDSKNAHRKESPRVRGTKIQWYMAVSANCALAQSTILRSK
jgi:hypothetical protein